MAVNDKRAPGLWAWTSSRRETSPRRRQRSALGVGVTTLVTILVVLLLTALAVLSLVSARSNLRLAELSTTQMQRYYAADTEATTWYAELDGLVATLEGAPDSYAEQLRSAGYTVQVLSREGGASELVAIESFALQEDRALTVTVAINDEKTTTIRQWQS